MSTAREIVREIHAYLQNIKAEKKNHENLQKEIERDRKNLEKAREAVEELPKKVDREIKRNKEREKRIEGLERNICHFLGSLESIKEEELKKYLSPNPLINLETCAEMLKKLLENPDIKKIKEKELI
ncbi:hypothetical protein RhiirA1_461968 [Rhizophagus irregularis]|uniref:Uncharacterized protein n=1 Tax=Rhizophagus irregularis TaxID=588596 RepID=A0A2I1F0U9_9GLOM|nr:hypothetical protein RhiirA1_461968 [Rhizophagus irregularis]PKY28000.1 hypothetical protein RhiirB3_390722 [Rhizophagus irregularis]CAB4474940.1 unnamed protein product [Rhizophagus irregularis]CAB5386663.1 unnamed protein product [Rhizophagus irregularis]